MGLPAIFEIVTDIPPLPLVIRDTGHPHDEHLTITNDVEGVVRRVAHKLTGGRRLLYIDSLNETCELVVKDGEFVDFKPIRKVGE